MPKDHTEFLRVQKLRSLRISWINHFAMSFGSGFLLAVVVAVVPNLPSRFRSSNGIEFYSAQTYVLIGILGAVLTFAGRMAMQWKLIRKRRKDIKAWKLGDPNPDLDISIDEEELYKF